MKKILCAFMLLCVTASCVWADVVINSANFPDEVFRDLIIAYEQAAGNGDGILSDAEISGINSVLVAEMGISSLKGIEYFTAITELECYSNDLTALDVSRNTNLTYIDCGHNQLTALDVSRNTALIELYCDENKLTALDVTRNTNLTYLDCGGNQIAALDVSRNTALTELYCGENKLTALDISRNTELTSLDCGVNQITALDVSNNTALTALYCSENKLTALDVSQNTKLTHLYCMLNQLTALDVSKHTALIELFCSDNKLMTLDVSSNTALKLLNCEYTQLTVLDVSNNTALTDLECGGNYLTALDVRGNNALVELSCYDNEITELDVSSNTNLTRLTCWENELTELDVRNNRALTHLRCGTNKLTELDVSNNTALIELSCSNAQLTELDVSHNTALTQLRFNINRLTDIDISRNTALTRLDCSDNLLTTLDLSHNTALTSLECSGNKFTALDISSNQNLKDIDCGFNYLTSIDVSNNTSLTVLDARGNQITAIDLSNNTSLEYVFLWRQRVTNLELTEHIGEEYPYRIDLNNYVTSQNINNIVPGSVKGLDKDNNEIETLYQNGIAQFISEPERVEYNYITGFGGSGETAIGKYMDVRIGTASYMTVGLRNHVYRIIDREMSWPQAKAYCESLGGHLATINTQEERDLILDLMNEASERNDSGLAVWVGGRLVIDSWSWVTGEDFSRDISESITYYSLTEEEAFYTPKGYEVDGACLTVYTNGDLMGWSDSIPNAFVCEWEPQPSNFAPLNPEYQRYISDSSAYFDDEFYGGIPEPLDLSHLKNNPPVTASSIYAADTLPAKFDPRDSGIVIPIREQGSYHTCWAFASIGALEMNYLTQMHGGEAPNLSELHQSWYVYKDPRPSYRYEITSKDASILNQGGHSTKSISFLSRAGTAEENVLPYENAADDDEATSNNIRNVERNEGILYPEDYSHPVKISDAYLLGEINSSNRQEVKELIQKHGAVAAAFYYSSGRGFNGLSDDSYYLNTDKNYGHVIDIIGWDDNYSRDNFKNKPNSNGAWLIKNSSLKHSIFWMSYEQKISAAAVYIADVSNNGDNYTLYGHDTIDAIDSVAYNWSMVVFKSDGKETLDKLAFHTRTNNVNYEIYIVKYGTKAPDHAGVPPESPVLSGTMKYCGYHTVKLNNPIELETDEYFGVMIKLSRPDGYVYSSAVADAGNIIRTSSVTPAGKSYFAMTDGKPVSSDWKDGKRLIDNTKERSCNACIKVFTISDVPVKITTTQLASGTEGRNYSYILQAKGSSITWTVTGLPSGMRLDENTITGTPSNSGTYNITITARDSKGRSDTTALQLVIEESSQSNSGESSEGGSGGGGCNYGFGLSCSAVIIFILRKKR